MKEGIRHLQKEGFQFTPSRDFMRMEGLKKQPQKRSNNTVAKVNKSIKR